MKTSELIEKLKSLGFKEYEAKVFVVLLKGSPMSASDIAADAKIIRNSIYDILKSFVEKGYCNEIETNTVLKYQIIDPQVILDKIIRDQNKSHKEKLDSLQNTFGDVQSLYGKQIEKQDVADTNIQLLRGFNKHRVEKYVELLRNSTKEVLGMYKLKGLVTEELNDLAEKLIKNGGKLRSIYQVTLDFKVIRGGKETNASSDDLIRVLEFFESKGEEVRLSEMKIPNITIFDREVTFTNLADKNIPKNKQADIIIQNTEYAGHMSDLFTYYWDNGMTISQYRQKVKSN